MTIDILNKSTCQTKDMYTNTTYHIMPQKNGFSQLPSNYMCDTTK